MKKGMKVCLGSVLLIGVGIVLAAIGFALGGRVTGMGWNENGFQIYGSNGLNDGKKSVYVDKEEELEEFDQMQVNMEYGDFTIESSDHYGISYHGREDSFTYQVRDGKLILSQFDHKSRGNNYFFFFGSNSLNGGSYEQESATVYVPQDTVLDSAAIENSSGNVNISGISANDLQVEADYGNVLLSDIRGEDFTVNMDSGDIIGNTVSVSQAEIKLDSGTCQLRKLDTDNITVESSYGGVELELVQPLEELLYDLFTDYGDVYISDQKMGTQYESLPEAEKKNVSVKCDSGDIEIRQAK